MSVVAYSRGFVGCETGIASSFHLRLSARGVPDVAGGSHRLSPGLFVAGDMRTGQSLVVRALADGRAAAEDVDVICGASEQKMQAQV